MPLVRRAAHSFRPLRFYFLDFFIATMPSDGSRMRHIFKATMGDDPGHRWAPRGVRFLCGRPAAACSFNSSARLTRGKRSGALPPSSWRAEVERRRSKEFITMCTPLHHEALSRIAFDFSLFHVRVIELAGTTSRSQRCVQFERCVRTRSRVKKPKLYSDEL